MEILHFEDLRDTSVAWLRTQLSSTRRVSNFNSNVPQRGIYPRIKFERDPLNTFRLYRAFTSSGSTGGRRRGGGDAKTIISPNISFGDIIIHNYDICK